MKILITGANGQLGRELRRCIAAGDARWGRCRHSCSAPPGCQDVDTLDITDLATSAAGSMCASRAGCDDLLLGVHQRRRLRNERDAAFAVNALVRATLPWPRRRCGAKLVHVSTDYVFSGGPNGGVPLDEAALPAPVSAYGTTKLLGEEYVRQFCRTQLHPAYGLAVQLYGQELCLYDAPSGQARIGGVTVVDDQLGNPTNAADLAHQILQPVPTKEYGFTTAPATGCAAGVSSHPRHPPVRHPRHGDALHDGAVHRRSEKADRAAPGVFGAGKRHAESDYRK